MARRVTGKKAGPPNSKKRSRSDKVFGGFSLQAGFMLRRGRKKGG